MQRIMLLFLWIVLSFQAEAQCPDASPGHHRVQKGETLYKIARTYRVTVDQLCEWNNISETDVISVCQELAIQPPKTTTEGRPISEVALSRMKKQEGGTHVIQEGETIAGLAELYGFTEKWFREFNGLNASEPAWPGLVLKTTDCICPSLSDTDPGFAGTGTPSGKTEDPYPSWEEFAAANEDAKTKTTTLEEDPFGETNTRPLSYEQPTSRIPATGTTARPQTGRQEETHLDPKVKRSIKDNPNAPKESYVPAEELLIERQSLSSTTSKPKTTPSAPTNSSPAGYLSAEETSMIREINLVRSNPPAYTRYIEDYKQKIINGTASGSLSTCQELIDELKRTPKLPVLIPSQCLYEAARLHALDQKPTGSLDHIGTDGSYPWDRVRRSCPDMTDGNENLVGGPDSVRDAVILLLLDENIPGRGHRRNILSRDWEYVSCYQIGIVGAMPNMWIQQFGK